MQTYVSIQTTWFNEEHRKKHFDNDNNLLLRFNIKITSEVGSFSGLGSLSGVGSAEVDSPSGIGSLDELGSAFEIGSDVVSGSGSTYGKKPVIN